MSLGSEEEEATDVISAMLLVDLPFFENESMSDLARARRGEPAFEDFRIAMDQAFGEIAGLPGSQAFQRQVDEISRDLLSRPIEKIERRMKALRRELALDAAKLVAGSLSSTIVTQGNTLAAMALAFVLGLDLYRKAKSADDEIRRLPSFFFWDVTRRGRRRSG